MHLHMHFDIEIDMHWYFGVLKKYAQFTGRASRMEYWMFTLFNTLIMIVIGVIEVLLGGPGIVLGVYVLATIIPHLAVAIRRLHDTNKPGWWFFIAFVPVVGAIVFLVFMCVDSDAGDNRYGSNPKSA